MDAPGEAALDRRLRPGSAAPIAVGFSGGGDSLAALIVAKAWADRCGRRVIALTLDHRLQPQGAGWVAFAAETAARLGVGFRALAWEGEKPVRGLPAAARDARHRLLAEAAREAGARVIVLGHTADDGLESELMRRWGSSLGSPREWSPSPAWPAGRELFLLRPLLGARRADLRAWLEARGERWIDDPANVDRAQTRARARAELDGSGAPAAPAQDDKDAAGLAAAIRPDAGGMLTLDRGLLGAAPAAAAGRVVAAAALSVGGGGRPPRRERVEALAVRLAGTDRVDATLCGARIVADAAAVSFTRNAGEVARGGLLPLTLPVGVAIVWDGRFELTADLPGLTVRPLAGLAVRLRPDERRALLEVAALARPALPAVVDPAGGVTCPILAGGAVEAHDLVQARILAACGVISIEPAT